MAAEAPGPWIWEDGDLELGIYSFGDVQRDPATGLRGSTAQAQRNLPEAIRVADQVGLDYFGIGEHHTREMPASAAATVLACAATVTTRIRRLALCRATGGSPASTVRAGQQGLPIAYGIIGGPPARFAPLADLYRAAARRAERPEERASRSLSQTRASSTKTSSGRRSCGSPTGAA